MTADQACTAATAASKKANGSDKPADHDAAADAHRKAASAYFKEGDPAMGKKHSKMAAQHAAKGGTKKKVNGLAAWMKSQK